MRKALLAGAVLAACPLAAQAQVENYKVDSVHSFPNFTVDHFGVSALYGRFDKMSGSFSIDRAAKKGSVELTIETASVTTGDNDKGSRPRSRDEHLRQADFFNVAEFPRMTYKSTNVKFNGDTPSEVEGQLTLLGQYGLALGAACGAFLLLAMILGKRVVAGTTFTLTASAAAALIAAGALILAKLPWTSLALFALVPLAVRLPVPEKLPAWLQAIVASLYALAPAAGACALAWQSSRTA